jgi:hypothetical protein
MVDKPHGIEVGGTGGLLCIRCAIPLNAKYTK